MTRDRENWAFMGKSPSDPMIIFSLEDKEKGKAN